MKNIKKVLFFTLIAMYALGILTGSINQVRTKSQDEMYAYLEGAVAGYDATISDSIKSVAWDNIKVLAILFMSGFFRIAPVVTSAIVLLKGYTAGFAITTMLRLYGLKGMLFCGANIISALILIPTLAYYGGAGTQNLQENRFDKKLFLKKHLIFIVLVTAIFCVDSMVRGFFSSIFMKLGANA